MDETVSPRGPLQAASRHSHAVRKRSDGKLKAKNEAGETGMQQNRGDPHLERDAKKWIRFCAEKMLELPHSSLGGAGRRPRAGMKEGALNLA